MKRNQTTSGVYTVDEASTRLKISRALCYRLAHEGKLPVLRLGDRLLIPKEPLERMLTGD